jgi:hypothetical protein
MKAVVGEAEVRLEKAAGPVPGPGGSDYGSVDQSLRMTFANAPVPMGLMPSAVSSVR